jgi:hypothetical protein
VNELEQAKALIKDLLLVLHDHAGSKKYVADRARAFLGLKPGAKVGTWEEKMAAKYPHIRGLSR